MSKNLLVTFLDLETTSKNANTCEILTCFVRTRNIYDFSIVDEDYFTFKPELYLQESYPIHKISYDESNRFSNKWDSFRNLLRYMHKYKDSLFCCHANHLVFGVHGYFDEQVIRQVSSLQSSKTYYWYLRQKFLWISTHTIAKKIISLDRYGLKDIANYYGFKFNHHNCKSDVEVTEKIFKKLIDQEITKEELFNIGNYNGDNRRFNKQSRGEFKI